MDLLAAATVEISPVIDLVVWLQVASTVFLAGLIWVIQRVHYPLMDQVSVEHFAEFHSQHTRRIGGVVVAPMLIELATAAYLLVVKPANIPPSLLVIGAILVAIIWISTFVLQVPQHRRLAASFDAATHLALVRGNWIRTVAWTVRAVVVIWVAVTAAG